MGTPQGPKYIPYTYMDPLGEFHQGLMTCMRSMGQATDYSGTSTLSFGVQGRRSLHLAFAYVRVWSDKFPFLHVHHDVGYSRVL